MSRTPLRTQAGAARRIGAAVASVVLAGCAARAPLPPPPVMVVPSQPDGPVVGVAVIEPQSDVADLTEAMRHVLHPRGDIGSASVTPTVLIAGPFGSNAGPGDARTGGSAPQPAALSRPASAPTPGAVLAPDPVEAALAVSGRDTESPREQPAAAPDTAAVREDVTSPQAAAAVDVDPPDVLQPGRAAQHAILAAWERYCVSSELSPEQWSIIDRTSMPASLEAEWAERCRPEK